MTALQLLRECAGPGGFLAAHSDRANYGRVWARDGCICGLAALASGDPALIAAFDRTLDTLEAHQAFPGQLPSNANPDTGEVSYGTRAGRIDATIWWLLGAALRDRDSSAVYRARAVLRAWEHNERGLLWVPMSGDWADEYVHHGYVLYDQALRLWALRADGLRSEAEALEARIADVFATEEGFVAQRHPGGDSHRFDAFATALCVLLEVGHEATRQAALDRAESLCRFDLVPAFHPQIRPKDRDWRHLEALAGGELRNRPGRYHNGGLWPVVNGFLALAAACAGRQDLADRLRQGVAAANARGFPEYLDANTGEPGGVQHLAWSAAGEILASISPSDAAMFRRHGRTTC